MIAHDEFRIHAAIVEHVQSAFPTVMFFHVPNQTRNATEAHFNKILGVRLGIPDLIFAWRGGCGMMEIKAADGKLSTAQNKTMSAYHAIGWHTGVARNVRSAHMLLMAWGLEPTHNAIREANLQTKEEKFKDAFDLYRPVPRD
jgi:hypothetical protein